VQSTERLYVLENLYWYTRGIYWGHCQLSYPKISGHDDNFWYSKAESIFKNLSVDDEFEEIFEENNEFKIIARKFIGGIKDENGRTIEHEFILLMDKNAVVPKNWHYILYDSLKTLHESLDDEFLKQNESIKKSYIPLIAKVQSSNISICFNSNTESKQKESILSHSLEKNKNQQVTILGIVLLGLLSILIFKSLESKKEKDSVVNRELEKNIKLTPNQQKIISNNNN
jgi:hypothetical protein